MFSVCLCFYSDCSFYQVRSILIFHIIFTSACLYSTEAHWKGQMLSDGQGRGCLIMSCHKNVDWQENILSLVYFKCFGDLCAIWMLCVMCKICNYFFYFLYFILEVCSLMFLGNMNTIRRTIISNWAVTH